MSTIEDANGPFVVWCNNGYEGWRPRSYPTLKAALLGERYSPEFVVTHSVEFEVVAKLPSEILEGTNGP